MEKESIASFYDFLRFLGLTLACMLLGFSLPFLGIVLIVFIPTPSILLIFRQGWRMGFLLMGTLVLLLSVLTSPSLGALFFVLFGGTGLIVAYCFDRGYSKETTLFIGIAGDVLLAGFFLFILATFNGLNVNELIAIQIDHNIAESLKLYETMKFGAEQIAVLRQSSEVLKTFFLNSYTGLYGVFATFMVLFNYLFSRNVLKRLGILVSDESPFTEYSFPDMLVWGVILGGGLWTLGGDPLNILGLNLSIFFIAIYGIQGFAILFFYINKTKLSKFAKVVLLFLSAMLPLILLLIALLGVFDTWFDFRKLKQKKLLEKIIT